MRLSTPELVSRGIVGPTRLIILPLLSLLLLSSSSHGQEPDEAAIRAIAEKAIEAIFSGDREVQSPAACDILRTGIVTDVFGVEDSNVNYRPASKVVPQALCTATWNGQEVALTIMKTRFESSEAAVRDLEATVERLEKGFTIKVAGRERTTQVDFDDFMTDVGDQAAWAPKRNELSVASGGIRYAVAVRGSGDGATNREKATELARLVAGLL